MASVRWRDDRKCWVACYSLPNGVRKQVSTGLPQEEKNQAMQVALKLEDASNLARRGSLTRARVLELLDEIAGAAGQRALISPVSVEVFLRGYVETNSSIWAEGTRKRYQEYIEQFLSGIGSRRNGPIATIDVMVLVDWRDDRLKAGDAPATVNSQAKFLRTVFAEALAQGAILENPFENLTPARSRKKKARIKQPFTRDHLERLLKVVDAEWRVLCLLGYYTGQRERDCRLLRWDHVMFEHRMFRFKRMKNDDVFNLPMHPRLERHLRWWRRRNPREEVILPRLSLLKQTGGAGFPQVFRFKILPRIGIEQPYSDGPGRTPSQYSFHSFRHALATALNEVGASEVDRMALVGHADKSISRGYTHTAFDHLRSVLARV